MLKVKLNAVMPIIIGICASFALIASVHPYVLIFSIVIMLPLPCFGRSTRVSVAA